MKTTLRRIATAAVLAAAFGAAPAGATLLTSDTVAQGGVSLSIKPPNPGTIGTFTFINPANSLASITGLEITMTIVDGDTGAGQFDEGDWTLVFDIDNNTIDTGLVLDGFTGNLPNNQTVTQTLSLASLGTTDAAALYADLIADGMLVAQIQDGDSDNTVGARDNSNGKNSFVVSNATLTLIGAAPTIVAPGPNNAIPEPATLALAGLGLAGVGWTRRRRPA